ncbi:hypothetical protein C8R44DRAFT_736234 [Mycena epipterygia]|nr:hypothetical protein C8R44DRAFT_736234 [Mycena epipterygia]
MSVASCAPVPYVNAALSGAWPCWNLFRKTTDDLKYLAESVVTIMKLFREEMDAHGNPDAKSSQICVEFNMHLSGLSKDIESIATDWSSSRFKKYLKANSMRDEITQFTRRVNEMLHSLPLSVLALTRMDLVEVKSRVSEIQKEVSAIRSVTARAPYNLNQQELVRFAEDVLLFPVPTFTSTIWLLQLAKIAIPGLSWRPDVFGDVGPLGPLSIPSTTRGLGFNLLAAIGVGDSRGREINGDTQWRQFHDNDPTVACGPVARVENCEPVVDSAWHVYDISVWCPPAEPRIPHVWRGMDDRMHSGWAHAKIDFGENVPEIIEAWIAQSGQFISDHTADRFLVLGVDLGNGSLPRRNRGNSESPTLLETLPEELHVVVQVPTLDGGRIGEPKIYWSADAVSKQTSSIPRGAFTIRFKWETHVESVWWQQHHYDVAKSI